MASNQKSEYRIKVEQYPEIWVATILRPSDNWQSTAAGPDLAELLKDVRAAISVRQRLDQIIAKREELAG